MAPHSSTLAWKIPRMEEPGGLQSIGSWSVGHDWSTSLSVFTFMHWRRKWQPTPVFLPGVSQGRGSLVGCRLWGHTGRTWLKWLSNSISSWFTQHNFSFVILLSLFYVFENIILRKDHQFSLVQSLSHVWLLATQWTAAHQAPPSVGFSRQEYWSGVPLPSPLGK